MSKPKIELLDALKSSDGLWRIAPCCCIGGMKPGSLPPGTECDHCMGGGMWIRPSGHTFLYPGGPATGYSGKVAGPEEYARAEPAPAPYGRPSDERVGGDNG